MLFSEYGRFLLDQAEIPFDIKLRYHSIVNSSHRKTLSILREGSVRTIEWRRIEILFKALGAIVVEGTGSRVRFEMNGVVATFHRPHPRKEAKPYQVKDAREFLIRAGVMK
ncbi:MAG: type II toxin-antitoxin system HicA family toxin [Wenzhouxiangellaceae bacterium]